jgi:hypothetical protein
MPKSNLVLSHTHALSHMDLLDFLDDHVLLYLLGRRRLACFVRACQLNHRTKRLCSIELQARLPALKALTSPPFEISLASSFGISGGTELNMIHRWITDRDMVVFSSAVSIKILGLDDNQISDEGMKAFSTALSSGALGALKVLCFTQNKISDAGMIAFADAIKPTDEIGPSKTMRVAHF